MLISIDPGLRTAGFAQWDESGRLLLAGLAQGSKTARDSEAWRAIASEVRKIAEGCDVVIEFPKVYPHGKGDPEDLLQLAAVVGAICASHKCLKVFRPYEWKGQVPKDVMVMRIQGWITDSERSKVLLPSAKSLQHNVWDAIGIGVKYLQSQGLRK